MILGGTLAAASEKASIPFAAGILGVMLFPLVARAFGLIASIVGILVVRTREDEDPMKALNRGYYVAALLAIVGFFVATKWLLANPAAPDAWWKYFLCGMIGVLTSIAFVYITQYYTEYKYRPVREIAEASQTGPATNIITGVAVGFECTLLPVIAISIAILASYKIGVSALPGGGLFGPRSRRWECSARRPTSSRWTRLDRSPTTPAESSRCHGSRKRFARKRTAWTRSATRPKP